MRQQISIPQPCHEDWNKMNPNNEGKFCSSCSKTVVDFTKMSKTEIYTYFEKKSKENICGHFYASQLYEKPKPSVFKKVNYLATLLLSLFLPLSSCKQKTTGEAEAIKKDTLSKKERTTLGVTLPINKPDSLKKIEKDGIKQSVEKDTLVDGNVEIKEK